MIVKRQLSFLALGCLLASVLGACGIGGAPAHTASGTEVHLNSANFVQAEITIQKGQSVTLINDDPLTPLFVLPLSVMEAYRCTFCGRAY